MDVLVIEYAFRLCYVTEAEHASGAFISNISHLPLVGGVLSKHIGSDVAFEQSLAPLHAIIVT